MKIKLSGILSESIVDGPGIRTVIFTQGCPHNCKGCHNPQTHDFQGGYEGDTEEIARQIAQNPLVQGLTFSGGEPLCQAQPLVDLAKRAGKHLVIYTGFTFEELIAQNDPQQMELLALCDTLIDGRYEESQRDLTLQFRGSRNQRLLDCKASLAAGKAIEAEF